jgi:hypothetical protein
VRRSWRSSSGWHKRACMRRTTNNDPQPVARGQKARRGAASGSLRRCGAPDPHGEPARKAQGQPQREQDTDRLA